MKKAYICMLIATVLFCLSEITMKQAGTQMNAIQLTFTRFLLGGLFLAPFTARAIKKRGLKVPPRQLGIFALLGLLQVVVGMLLYQIAVVLIPASSAAILFSASPMFISIFALIILREKIHGNEGVGLALNLLSIIFIVNPLGGELSFAGVFCIILSTCTYSIYSVLSRSSCVKYSSEVTTCAVFLMGGAELAVVSALTHIPAVAGWLSSIGLENFANVPFIIEDISVLPLFLFIAFAITGFGYWMWFVALEFGTAHIVSLTFFIKPILATFFSYMILGEAVTLNMKIGIAIAVAAAAISTFPTIARERRLETD